MMSVMNATNGKNALTPKVNPKLENKDPFFTARNSDTYLSGKMIGGYVPQSTAQYFQLLALQRGQSIQKTLQQMIEEWNKLQQPEEDLIEDLAIRAFDEYKRRLELLGNKEKPQDFLDNYLKEIQVQLRRHRVMDIEYTTCIIISLKKLIKQEV